MKPQGSKTKTLFTPCPAGLHPGVFVDIYYSYDVETVWEGKTRRKDCIHIVAEMDPSIGLTTVDGVERPHWVAQRETINARRVATEDFVAKIHKEFKNKETGKMESHPYKVGEDIFGSDYDRYYLDYGQTVAPEMDANGQPDFFVGSKHNFYQRMLEFSGDDFLAALETGDLSPESLVGANARFMITHGKPDKNGQVWPRIKSLMPAEEGSELKPSSYYIRVKDREPTKEDDTPF
jgi:hypothetical protein